MLNVSAQIQRKFDVIRIFQFLFKKRILKSIYVWVNQTKKYNISWRPT